MHTTRTESEREKCKGSDRGSREIQREIERERDGAYISFAFSCAATSAVVAAAAVLHLIKVN